MSSVFRLEYMPADNNKKWFGRAWHQGGTFFLALLLVVFSGSLLAKNVEHHWKDKRYIEDSFYDIVLRGEYERVRPVVRKWTQPLRIWVSSTAGDADEQLWLVAMHFVHIGDIIGLPVEFVDRREQANVRVFFTSDKQAPQVVTREMSALAVRQLDHSVCIGQIRFNRWAEITRGTVVIPVERAQREGKMMPCVVEEMTQMLGLINDSERFYPTGFSDITEDELLTGLDYLLLKLLYSPNLRNGMTVAQAAPVIRRQLDAWERSGLIHNADHVITNGPLYASLEPAEQ